jgi:exopolysaccharide biosynthesis polyprenyl glycosylphosphotransferase
MFFSRKTQSTILLLGDILIFYVSLLATLTIRYLSFPNSAVWNDHKWPFFYIHIIWLAVFYASGLYELKILASPKVIFRKIVHTIAVSGLIAVLIFYLIPFFEITPKTNLLIDITILIFLLFGWRRLFWIINSKANKIKILFFGSSKETEELILYLIKHPQIGYEPKVVLAAHKEGIGEAPFVNSDSKNNSLIKLPLNHNLIPLIKKYNIQLIIASKNMIQDKEGAKRFYEVLPLGISIMDFPSFYEITMGKIPVSLITESWFLENLMEINKRTFEFFKRGFDVAAAIILGIPTLMIYPLISGIIKMESKGPALIKQKRVGKNGKLFEIIKFRSMIALSPEGLAEKNGAIWSKKEDCRITTVGKFIRKTRIDELPQLWNVLKGEMSFIGPRPERPEFVKELENKIPHYPMRHLVRPGLSGWAQINLPYGASVEYALEKLQYDLFYIKNRSFALEAAISLKTIAAMIRREGR